jgi:hypothetical protein
MRYPETAKKISTPTNQSAFDLPTTIEDIPQLFGVEEICKTRLIVPEARDFGGGEILIGGGGGGHHFEPPFTMHLIGVTAMQ